MDKLQGQQQSIKECRTIEKKKSKKQTNKALKKEINSLHIIKVSITKYFNIMEFQFN